MYESLEEIDKYLEYHEILETWKVLREGREEDSVSRKAFDPYIHKYRLFLNNKEGILFTLFSPTKRTRRYRQITPNCACYVRLLGKKKC